MSARLPLGLAALVAALFVASLMLGPARIPPGEAVAALFGGTGGPAELILQEVRLPRALLAALVGASLGLSGAALQGFLRNPLAEPGVIGVSGAAALGAVVTFYSGLAGAALWVLPAGALGGAAVAVLILLAIAARAASSLTLILGGVAIASLAGALTSLVLNLSPNPFASYEIIFWLLGSIKDRSMDHVWIALPLMAAGWALILGSGRALDALLLGEAAAEGMGVDLRAVRVRLVAGIALAVGAGTAVTGAIGFIGLVVPHLLRPLTNRMPGALLVPSALGGAALLLAADIAARLLVPGRELNVGVVTALLGAPFFLWLVTRLRGETA